MPVRVPSSSSLWAEIQKLLKEEDEHVCVLPMMTIIQPIRVITLLQVETTVTATATPCPPGSVNLPPDEPAPRRDLKLSLTTGTANWQLVRAPLVGVPPESSLPLGDAPEVLNPHAHWKAVPDAKWLGTASDIAPGEYTFELGFQLSAAFSNPRGQIALRTDDHAKVYLNDEPIGETPQGSFADEAVTAVPLGPHVQWLRAGDNTLKVVVTNTNSSPMGLALSGLFEAEGGECVE